MNDQPLAEPQRQDYIYALAVPLHFTQNSPIFAARATGLYRSDDGGLTWQNSYQALNLAEPLSTTTIALSPAFEADQTLFAGAPGGILRSIDGGSTWQITMLPEPPPTPSALTISPNFSQDEVVLVGTMADGVFRSADGGAHWEAWNFGLLDLNIITLAVSPAFAQDETLYAGAESGLFRSTNGGRAWREINLPAGFDPVLSLALSPNYAQDETLFAGTETKGLFCSSDRGHTWTALAEDKLQGSINAIILASNYPHQPHLLVMLDNTLLLSLDAGHTWSNLTPSLTQTPTAIAAPSGLGPQAPLLVGLANGQVTRLTL